MSPQPRSPDISLVIAAYNAEPFVGRAIHSVLSQVVPPREVIVVDDGSSDGTADVVRRFGSAVTLLRQRNAGPGAARNAGIRASTGALVAFLDADDELLPRMTSVLSSALSSHPQAMAASGAHVYENGAMTVRPTPGEVLRRGPVGLLEDFFETSRHHHVASVGATMARRGALIDVGGFREDVRFGEDIDLWTRLAGRYPWAFVDEPVLVYHHTPATSATLRTAESQKPVNWLMDEERMRAHVRAPLWPSYRKYRRDLLARQARTALHEGAVSTARRLLAAIPPAPVSIGWAATLILSRSRRLGQWSIRGLNVGRAMAARLRASAPQDADVSWSTDAGDGHVPETRLSPDARRRHG